MTDRMAALERVAEAAREYYQVRQKPHGQLLPGEYAASRIAMEHALAALPAEPVGETVTMRAAIFSNGGEQWTILGLSHHDDAGVLREAADYTEGGDEEHIAWLTVPVRVSRPTIPTVAARVEG